MGNRLTGFYATAILLLVASSLSLVARQSTSAQLPRLEGRQRTDTALQRMTEAQRIHATLHQSPDPDKPPLLDRVESRIIFDDHYAAAPSRPLAAFVRDVGCASNLILVGTPQTRSSFPLADGTFFFTDYSFHVESVWRDAASSGIEAGQTITVSRLGGEIVVDGIAMKAVRRSLPLLITGQRYLLFGDFVPATGALLGNRPSGTFVLQGSQARSTARERVRGADLAVGGVPESGLKTRIANLNCSGGGR